MEIAWLEDMIALVDTGTFSRAAARRHITQPAFSRRVRAFEDWVGTPLFERTARGATLTPAGERFAAAAPGLVRAIGDARADARDVGRREGATLLFAATHALSFTFFPSWLRAVEQRTTVGPVRLVSDSMAACEELMVAGQVQFVLCHRNPVAPSRLDGGEFLSLVVGEDALLPLAAPDAAGAPRWRLGDGAAGPLLAYSAESGLGRILAASGFDAQRSSLTSVFSAQLAATLLGMAVSGRGIAWLPASLAADEIERGRLVRAGDAGWDIPVAIRLIRPAARQSAVAEGFWREAAGG